MSVEDVGIYSRPQGYRRALAAHPAPTLKRDEKPIGSGLRQLPRATPISQRCRQCENVKGKMDTDVEVEYSTIGGNAASYQNYKKSNVVSFKNAAGLKEALTNDTKPSMVCFYADWCGNCGKYRPTYDQLSLDQELSSMMNFYKIDGDKLKANDLQSLWNINFNFYPTLALFKNGTWTMMKENYEIGKDRTKKDFFIETYNKASGNHIGKKQVFESSDDEEDEEDESIPRKPLAKSMHKNRVLYIGSESDSDISSEEDEDW